MEVKQSHFSGEPVGVISLLPSAMHGGSVGIAAMEQMMVMSQDWGMAVWAWQSIRWAGSC